MMIVDALSLQLDIRTFRGSKVRKLPGCRSDPQIFPAAVGDQGQPEHSRRGGSSHTKTDNSDFPLSRKVQAAQQPLVADVHFSTPQDEVVVIASSFGEKREANAM